MSASTEETGRHLSVLILDDEPRITDELSEYLGGRGFATRAAQKPSDALEQLRRQPADILILDLRLPEMDGLKVLKRVRKDHPDTEVIMITGHGDMNTVIEALRHGAIDFLRKPFRHMDVQVAIERTSKFLELQHRVRLAEDRTSLISRELEQRIERDFIGESKAIHGVLERSMQAAEFSNINALITGESGTGKEIVARIIHHASDRRQRGFFAVNCATIPENLMESEFFGHRRGAFTGADRDKLGFFELARGGTLFLDEIAETTPTLQVKLLRAIEEKRIRRLGDRDETEVDVRVVAATNRELEDLIGKDRFRLDLYHRLNTIQIHIPPLRERPQDIQPLLEHFVESFSRRIGRPVPRIGASLVQVLRGYEFPGNVRELKNLVERAMIICDRNELDPASFPLPGKPAEPARGEPADLNLEKQECRLIQEALLAAGQNQIRAAELLGISRHALIRRMEKHGLRRPEEP